MGESPAGARRQASLQAALEGSRVGGKLPQDVISSAVDPTSGARADIVADGVSECLAAPPIVRRFAGECAGAVAEALVAAAADLSGLLPGPTRGFPRSGPSLLPAERRLRRAVAGSLRGPLLAPRWRGAGCVLGGYLWIPDRRAFFLVAAGNITAACLSSPRRGDPWVGLLCGEERTLLEAGGPAPRSRDVSVVGLRLAPGALRAVVISDGVLAIKTQGRLVARLRGGAPIEHEDPAVLALLTGLRASHTSGLLSLLPGSPIDDATLLLSELPPQPAAPPPSPASLRGGAGKVTP